MSFQRVHPLLALKDNPFVLAPMAGITDHAFRSFMRALDAGVVVTELVSSHGIQYKSDRTLSLMSFDETQRPIGIQLFGEEPEIVAHAAQVAEEAGADFIDLNFGCPVPKVVKKGAGSAMLKDLPAMQKMLSATVKAVKIPVTIKIRTGWDSTLRNAQEVCRLAADEGITWVAIHGRTRAQGYSGWADWDYISEVKNNSPLPVLGNGDIHTPEQAVQRLKSSGCDGVLIGRGSLKNPFIFFDALRLWKGQEKSKEKRLFTQVFKKLFEYLQLHCEPHLVGIQLKKFAAWYSTGYPGASAFRREIFQTQDVAQTLEKTLSFFESISTYDQEDTSREEFLMGGHG
ncbi:MAG: tRNA dihydrouridine synthase DusB [Bdellovibrionales bacterium]